MNDLQEMDAMLAERVVQWTEKWKQEGMQQGMQLGEAAALERQITRRFGPPDDAIRRRIASASQSDLERWLDNILDARNLDDVFRPG